MRTTDSRIARGLRALGLLLPMALAVLTAASAAGVTYEYDQLGRLRKEMYEDGTVIVYSFDAAGNRTSVATGIDTTAPTVPAALGGTTTATPTVVLTWTASTDTGVGIGGYKIYRNGATTPIAVTNGAAATFTDTTATGLIGSTTYTYQVSAYDLVGNESGKSTPVLTVTTPVVSETIPPSVPTGLAVVATSQTATALTWNVSTDTGGSGLQGYKVYRNGSATPVGTSTTNSYSDSGLTAGTYYEYKVAAYDRANNTSAQSLPASLTTPSVPPGNVYISVTAPGYKVYEGPASVAITLARDGGTYTALTVTCSTGADTTAGAVPATAGADYTVTTRVVSWAANDSTPKTCSIPIVNDEQQESVQKDVGGGFILPWYDETFAVTLSNPVGGGITGSPTTVVTITDDDYVPDDHTPPNQVTGLAAAYTGTNTVTLNWNATTDTNGKIVAYWLVKRCSGATSATVCTPTYIAGPYTNSYTDTTATAGLYWNYQVTAVDAGNNVGTDSTKVQAFADTSRPSTPGGFAATALGSTSIRLTWSAATDNVGVTNYIIDRCTGAGCSSYAPLTTVGTALPLQFDDTGLSASTTYGYRIVARDAAMNTSLTPATTSGATQAPPDTQRPTTPGSPAAVAQSATTIRLTWTASTDNVGVVGYMIERCVASSCTYSAVNSTPIAALTYDDTGVTGATTYNYRISARDAALNLSLTPATTSATTYPAVPPAITVPTGTNTTGSYPVSWTASGGTGVTYSLQESKNDAAFGAPTTFTGLTGNNQSISGKNDGDYWYRVQACNATGCSAYRTASAAVIVRIPDASPPTTPGSPTATAQSATTVRLTWTVSTDNIGVVGYMIERCPASSCTYAAVNATPVNALTYDDTSASSATTYNYRIKARDAANNDSTPSTVVSATTYVAVPPGITVPTGTNTTGNYNVSWVAAGGTGVTYELQESKNDSGFGAPTTVSGLTGVTQPISGKTDGAYWYRVRACNVMGCSTYRTASSAVTVLIPDLTRPTTPQNPGATILSTTSVRFSWSASTDDRAVTGYRVWRCIGAGCTPTLYTSTAANVLSIDDTGLTPNTMYRYQVVAFDAANNESDPASSIVAGVTFPDVPGSVTMPSSPNTNGSYNVSWAAVGGPVAVTYDLQESKNDSGFSAPSTFTGLTGTLRSFAGQSNGTYYYRVRACNTWGCGGYRTASTSVTVQIPDTTQPGVPPNMTAVAVSSTVARITWGAATDNVGVTGYAVWRCTTAACSVGTQVGTTANNVFTYDDSILAGVTVWYHVRAFDAANNISDPSPAVSVTTLPPVPLTLSVPGGTSTTGAYDLSWTIASGQSITYEIQEAKNDSSFGSGITNYSSNGTVLNVTGRTTGTYYYRIRACNSAGCSGYLNGSNAATVNIPAATQIFIDNVSISGAQPSGPLGFTYGLSASGQVLISGNGALFISGPAHTSWLFPVSGMNQYQVNATTTCPNGTGIGKTGTFGVGTWQALGASTISWGINLPTVNRSALCTITLSVAAISNPTVILDTGVIDIDLSTAP